MKQIKQLLQLGMLLACGLLASCSEDNADNLLPDGKYPIEFSATMEGLTTRATVDNTWDGGEQVAVSIDGAATVPFAAAANGTLTPNTPIYWQTATQSITAKAWSPAGWTMQADQSTEANYKAADFVFAPTIPITYATRNAANLTFSHKTAKVTATLTAGEGVSSLTGATVSFYGYTSGIPNTDNGTITGSANDWIKSYNSTGSTFNALLIPQNIVGQKFIKVTHNGNDYYYTPQAGEADLQAGKHYTYSITVWHSRLDVTLSTTWISGGADIDGEGTGFYDFNIYVPQLEGVADISIGGVPQGVQNLYTLPIGAGGKSQTTLTITETAGKWVKSVVINGICQYAYDGWNPMIPNQYTFTINDICSDLQVIIETVNAPSPQTTPQIGDFYYQDGIVYSELVASLKTCIGVFYKSDAVLSLRSAGSQRWNSHIADRVNERNGIINDFNNTVTVAGKSWVMPSDGDCADINSVYLNYPYFQNNIELAGGSVPGTIWTSFIDNVWVRCFNIRAASGGLTNVNGDAPHPAYSIWPIIKIL